MEQLLPGRPMSVKRNIGASDPADLQGLDEFRQQTLHMP